MNRTRTLVAIPALTAAVTVGLVMPAAVAAPPSNGCPAGYTLLSVTALYNEGYRVPSQIDDPSSGLQSFGQAGNGDGLVCGVQLGNQTTSFGGPIYNFIDNSLPA